jgi:hypothetical protein
MATTLSGPASIAFRDFVIPASVLSEVTVTLTEGERERTTLAGTFKKGSRTFDEVMATATLYIPSMDWLGRNILRARYNASEESPGSPAEETPGNVIFNSDACTAEVDAGPVNIHYDCEGNDANDVYFYNANLKVNLEMTYNADDDLQVELTFFGQPDDDGNVVRLGTGDLTQESVYDPDTQATIAVS